MMLALPLLDSRLGERKTIEVIHVEQTVSCHAHSTHQAAQYVNRRDATPRPLIDIAPLVDDPALELLELLTLEPVAVTAAEFELPAAVPGAACVLPEACAVPAAPVPVAVAGVLCTPPPTALAHRPSPDDKV